MQCVAFRLKMALFIHDVNLRICRVLRPQWSVEFVRDPSWTASQSTGCPPDSFDSTVVQNSGVDRDECGRVPVKTNCCKDEEIALQEFAFPLNRSKRSCPNIRTEVRYIDVIAEK